MERNTGVFVLVKPKINFRILCSTSLLLGNKATQLDCISTKILHAKKHRAEDNTKEKKDKQTASKTLKATFSTTRRAPKTHLPQSVNILPHEAPSQFHLLHFLIFFSNLHTYIQSQSHTQSFPLRVQTMADEEKEMSTRKMHYSIDNMRCDLVETVRSRTCDILSFLFD